MDGSLGGGGGRLCLYSLVVAILVALVVGLASHGLLVVGGGWGFRVTVIRF